MPGGQTVAFGNAASGFCALKLNGMFLGVQYRTNRQCLCCDEFYAPDHRNVRHQRYCSKPACRAQSKALSQ